MRSPRWHPRALDTTTSDTETAPFVVAGDGGVVVGPEGTDLLLADAYSHHGSDHREYVRHLDVDEAVYVAGETTHTTSCHDEVNGSQCAVERAQRPRGTTTTVRPSPRHCREATVSNRRERVWPRALSGHHLRAVTAWIRGRPPTTLPAVRPRPTVLLGPCRFPRTGT